MLGFNPFLLLILFFGISWVLRRIKLIKTMTETQARRAAQQPGSPPASFQEAAPVIHKQPAQTSRAQEGAQVSKPGGLQSMPLGFEGRSFQEGQRLEPTWGEAMDEKYLPAKAAAPRKPRSPIIPQFTGSSVVQAIVTKEILTRPRSAKRLGHS